MPKVEAVYVPVTGKYYLLDYKEVESLAQRYLQLSYDYVADMEADNDTAKVYWDIVTPDYDDNEVEMFEVLRGGNIPTHGAWLVLGCLVDNKILPPGDYIIEVCW